MAKKYIKIFFDQKDTLKELEPEEFKNVMMSVLDYAENGEVPNFETRIEKLAFVSLKKFVDKQNEAYERKCEQNRRAAEIRWEFDDAKKDACACECIENNANALEKCQEQEQEQEQEQDQEQEQEQDQEQENKKNKEKRIEYQLIADMYNETCVSFPRLNVLSNKRKQAIKARLKTFTLKQFQEMFLKAERSAFLKGQNNRNWQANFDWLVKDSNFAKVLDGNYDDKPKKPPNNQNDDKWCKQNSEDEVDFSF